MTVQRRCHMFCVCLCVYACACECSDCADDWEIKQRQSRQQTVKRSDGPTGLTDKRGWGVGISSRTAMTGCYLSDSCKWHWIWQEEITQSSVRRVECFLRWQTGKYTGPPAFNHEKLHQSDIKVLDIKMVKERNNCSTTRLLILHLVRENKWVNDSCVNYLICNASCSHWLLIFEVN